ncbi:MAG: dihydrofolate reductase [Saprospiraceae bacterium]|nr:dihydrofolate reductase [Saprospiraceae bacterium]
MRNLFWLLAIVLVGFSVGCSNQEKPEPETTAEEEFVWSPESFADKKIIRYQVPGFEKLSLQQKKLVYYLVQSGLAGRDIIYDQLYRHNLKVRKALEHVLENYNGDKSTDDWKNLERYAKNVFFSNGIHHHYSSDKFNPDFSREYFEGLLKETGHELSDEVLTAMFDPAVDNKRTNFDPSKGLVKGSSVNFYDPDITEAEVDAFYSAIQKSDEAIEYGLNSKLVRGENGQLMEKSWSVNGMYGAALKEVVSWLEKAVGVAENEAQANALKLLIEYYNTGDLNKWKEFNVAWVQATEGDIDYIHGFVEVYNDPKGYKGSFENIIQIKDFDASARMEKVAASAQWFEDNSPIMDQHKRAEATGVSYKVVSVAGESGDASPSTPIGVNLPNSNPLRVKYGSKSVSLGNIITAYANADGPGLLQEFALNDEQIKRAQDHGQLAGKIHTALHEVIGHASGQLEPGVPQPATTLKSYSSPLEEARADLVALYFIMDSTLVEMGLMESLEVGKAEYESYLRNGLMLQLRRIEPGKNIEQAHMRNRQMVSNWVLEKGKADNVVEMIQKDGKTYIQINDYMKLRDLFGQLLREVQRIKSQGDYEAGKNLIETYGVQVNQDIHKEVLSRSEKLNIPPYGGFINPKYVPVTDDNGEITDIKLEYPDDFLQQMLDYGKNHSFLPVEN